MMASRIRVITVAFAAAILGLGIGACSSGAPAAPGTPPAVSPAHAGVTRSPAPSVTPPQPTPASPAPASPAPARPTVTPSGPQVSPALVTRTAHTGRYVALTFDDGPNPTYTPQVLALLQRYGIHATFCVIGDNAQVYPDLVRQVVAAGNRLCDHTMTHDEQLGAKPVARIAWEIATCKHTLQSLSGGADIRYYRQPGGNWTATIRQIAAAGGMQSLSWSVDPRDWSLPGTGAIVSRVEANLKPGSVVLMHDGDGDVGPGGGNRSESVAALRILIPWMIQQGYHFDFPA
jgi:peptidoglycan-N-acetylglucosamine deacetylase